jgi:G3E family GTPase
LNVPRSIAVHPDEFGDTAIDDKLLAANSKFKSEEEIIEVLNGCICCSVRGDLVNMLKKLAARTAAGELALDGIIIETTGMADPSPVAQTFLVDDDISAYSRIDGIVTLVDAKHIELHLSAVKPDGVVNEAKAQVAFADRLLLNKTDLVSADDLERIEAKLRGINGVAPILRCTKSDVSVDRVLGIHGFDLQRALTVTPGAPMRALSNMHLPPPPRLASVPRFQICSTCRRHRLSTTRASRASASTRARRATCERWARATSTWSWCRAGSARSCVSRARTCTA